MIKKGLILFFCMSLFGCSTQIKTLGGISEFDKDIGVGSQDSFNVAVLLPTTGAYASAGIGMRNAAQMALEDTNNKNLVLRFYDTKSTPDGTEDALDEALLYNPSLIIGPLLSSNLDAIEGTLNRKEIPTISFATNQDLLSKNIFSIGLLSQNQTDRMFQYVSALGKTKFALLLPENITGQSVEKSAAISAAKFGIEIISTTFYPPQTTDFSETLKEMTNYNERKKLMDEYKLELEAKAEYGDKSAEYELKTLGETDAMKGVDFDAVLIADSGAKLKSALSMFGYYDVSSPEVLFFGTSVWDGTPLANEENAIGSLYPALSRQYSAYFNSTYNGIYKQSPITLYALAYDAVALASALSDSQNITTDILKQDGYAGMNGVFRFLENGNSEHVLDIYQITKTGNKIIDFAPKSFQ